MSCGPWRVAWCSHQAGNSARGLLGQSAHMPPQVTSGAGGTNETETPPSSSLLFPPLSPSPLQPLPSYGCGPAPPFVHGSSWPQPQTAPPRPLPRHERPPPQAARHSAGWLLYSSEYPMLTRADVAYLRRRLTSLAFRGFPHGHFWPLEDPAGFSSVVADLLEHAEVPQASQEGGGVR